MFTIACIEVMKAINAMKYFKCICHEDCLLNKQIVADSHFTDGSII